MLYRLPHNYTYNSHIHVTLPFLRYNLCTVKCTQWLPWRLRWYGIHLQCRRPGFDPWVGKIPWRRERQPTPVFLPGESHSQRSLVGCSPQG